MHTGFFTHAQCAAHEMGSWHPESPERLAAVHDHLIAVGLLPHLLLFDAPQADLDAIARAHDRAYIERLRARVPKQGYEPVDPDTSMNNRSWDAALHAAGAVVAATDLVKRRELNNAFCAVRPPGHHACRAAAMGFCFFNNVAIGALHALHAHGLKRVAVIDQIGIKATTNEPSVLSVAKRASPRWPWRAWNCRDEVYGWTEWRGCPPDTPQLAPNT